MLSISISISVSLDLLSILAISIPITIMKNSETYRNSDSSIAVNTIAA